MLSLFKASLRLAVCSLASIGLNFATSFTFQTYSVSGASKTSLSAINDSGVLAGTYVGSNGQTYAFLDKSGVLSTLGGVNSLGGLNSKGQAVGSETLNGNSAGYAWAGGKVSYTVASQTGNLLFTGINTAGDVVWQNQPAQGGASNVSIKLHGGQSLHLSIGSATSVTGGQLNDSGQFVGSYQDATGSHGFIGIINGQTIATQSLNVPGATLGTYALGIDSNGDVVGYSGNASGGRDGFVYTNGLFTTVDVPGSVSTEAFGVNDSGEIVGIYDLPSNPGEWYSFLAMPGGLAVPEPSLCVLGLGALLFVFGANRSILVSSKQKAKCSTPKDSLHGCGSESPKSIASI